jgi:hypothetical protein
MRSPEFQNETVSPHMRDSKKLNSWRFSAASPSTAARPLCPPGASMSMSDEMMI